MRGKGFEDNEEIEVVLRPEDLDIVEPSQIISDHNSFYNIGLSNEACYKTVFGLVVNISRRTDLLNFAVIHNDHGIRHRKGFLLVMRNINEGNSNLLLDFFQLDLHLFSYFRIQGAKRLVKKKDFRLMYRMGAY